MANGKTILKNTNLAAAYFGASHPGTANRMTAIPRYKYMFYATFRVNSQAYSMYNNLKTLGNWQNGVSFKIKTIDKPNVDISQRELNQYNRKRYAYVKTEYRPVNVSLYDTVDNTPFNLWVEYFTYYFGDARYKSQATMGTSPVDPTFDDSTGWGLRPLVEQINFFTSLDVYALYGKEYTLTRYLNPKIASIDWGNHDTSSSELEDLRMSLSYETLQYDAGIITPNLAAQFGFGTGSANPSLTDGNPFSYLEPNLVQHVLDDKAPASPQGIQRPPVPEYTAITSPSSSTILHFGMSGASYDALVGGTRYTVGNTRTDISVSGVPAPTQVSGQSQFASSVGAPDTVYGSAGVGGNPSDIPTGENQGIQGLPGGQLPYNSQYVPLPSADIFATISGFGVFNLLGSFGNFNFGAGSVPEPLGGNNTFAYDPISGLPSIRPGAPNDSAGYTALPAHRPGQHRPNLTQGYHNRLNTNYSDGFYLTQYQQIQSARRRVQQGEVSLTIAIGDPVYTNDGIYTGYDQAPYQPVPYPAFGPGLAESASLSNNTTGSFGYLDDPSVFGGDPSDNLPPPVIIPYRNYNIE